MNTPETAVIASAKALKAIDEKLRIEIVSLGYVTEALQELDIEVEGIELMIEVTENGLRAIRSDILVYNTYLNIVATDNRL